MLRITEQIENVQRKNDSEPMHVKCRVLTDDNEEKIVTLHKTEVELIEFMNAIARGAKLPNTTMSEIWNKIQRYGQHQFALGQDSVTE